ncbi:MAG TPA: hypothetical protein VKX49_04360 [Bryobacteraceae bacterium]|nr:hypothetical protein [Bryobacteraceae bacterium]
MKTFIVTWILETTLFNLPGKVAAEILPRGCLTRKGPLPRSAACRIRGTAVLLTHTPFRTSAHLAYLHIS